MLIIASANAHTAIDTGWDLLSAGASALDAAEAVVRMVEDDPTDHTVGYGGYPNVDGDVECDASVMDGTTRKTGAVGALRGFRYPVSVARAVMDRLPHVLLVGDGAALLADEAGAERRDMLSEEARTAWEQQMASIPAGTPLSERAHLATDPERVTSTVNVLVRDTSGRIASAVSTSGWAWKYPGRLGDSPVAGAGFYADDRFGAAACTGLGELTIRASTCRTVVWLLQSGLTLDESCRIAIEDLISLGAMRSGRVVHLIAIDAHGHHAAYTSADSAEYAYRTPEINAAATAPRISVVVETPS